MKRNRTEPPHLKLLKVSAITNEKDIAFLHSGHVNPDLIITPRQRTAEAERLAQLGALLNYLEKEIQILQYKLQEVCSTLNIDTEEVRAVRLPSTTDTTGIESDDMIE